MSYGGFEYNQSNQPMGFGGFDVMGGGGFMDTDSGIKQESGKKPGRGDRSIMPVTIKQLYGASVSPDGIFIDNTPVNQVRLLGIIESIEDQSTSVIYQINDGTGGCECKYWKDSDNGTSRYSGIRQFEYVRIEGQLRDYEGKKHVLVYDIKRVEDWNEMTHHYLDTIYVHLYHTRGPIATSNPTGGSHNPGFGTPSRNTFIQPSFGSNGGAQALHWNDGRSSDVKKRLFDAFKDLDQGSEEGVDVAVAFDSLRREGHSDNELRSALHALAEEGLLYSTIDEDHYKSTE